MSTGDQVKTEDNVLRDGTLIDLCGATLLWRSAIGLLSAPVSVSLSSLYSFSLRFNDHFPGVPGLADARMSPFWILLALRLNEIVVTTGAVRRAKLQSKCHHHQSAMCCLLVSYILYFVKFIFISFQGSC